jgi:glycosyltransferase involved in cell wall biosynthesis
MKNLVSIIVPVYNAEVYLERCINSIRNQTYRNLEIILVDDGSNDHSLSICEHFQDLDNRIKVIAQENGGSSIARNTGLDNANGDIIGFVDSDDHINEDMIEIMVNLLNYNHLDVIEIERNSENQNKVFDNKFYIEDKYAAAERIIRTTAFQVWKRLYRSKLIEDMRFIPHIIHQDAFYTVDVLNRIDKIGFLNSPLYRYNRDSIGIITSNYSEMKRDVSVRIIDYIKSNIPLNERVQMALDSHIVYYYTDHFMMISRNTEFDKDGSHRKKLRTEIRKAFKLKNLDLRVVMVLLLPLGFIEMLFRIVRPLKSN